MKSKKGISLIVLIITIIVVIILAAAVIITINKNNPVESAKEATFKEDVRIFQDDLALTVAKEYTDKQGCVIAQQECCEESPSIAGRDSC